MMQKLKLIILLFSILLCSIAPIEVDAAHPVLERLSKRYFKKNKLKKLGKRAQRAAMDIDLEEYSIKFEHDIIGMEPSWMIEEGYFTEHYFNLLSTLVIGEYDINPKNGLPRNKAAMQTHLTKKSRDKRAKENFNIIESANFSNSRLNFLLHLTYSDDFGNNSRFFRNSLLTEDQVFNNLTDSLTSYFTKITTDYKIAKERTGIYVQFDFGDKKNLDNYLTFLERIHEQLDEEQLVYVVVPANIKRGFAYDYDDIDRLLEFADRIVIDATNFDTFEKKRPVPPTNFSPKTDYSLFGTLKKYLISPEIAERLPHDKAGEYLRSNEVAERRSKLAVMLPYYGFLVKTTVFLRC